jgi:predicted nucleic acid-binding protein
MILVDSSVWIDYFEGIDAVHTRKLQSILGQDDLGTGDLIIAEVLQGYSKKKEFDAVLDVLDACRLVVIGSRGAAIQAARNYIYLRSIGFTIGKTVDTLIATRCILSGHELLHNDKDFHPFERHLGLKCVI